MRDDVEHYDTLVVDVPLDGWKQSRARRDTVAPPIYAARVPTRELDVHVQLDDGWHKLDPNEAETACGIRFNPRHQLRTRVGRLLEHPLAEKCDCWTRREREKADAHYLTTFRRPYEPWGKP